MVIEGSTLRIDATVYKDGTVADLTSATVVLKYRDPDGDANEWSAVIDTPLLGTCHVTTVAEQPGTWTVWVEAELQDFSILVTAANTFRVYAVGTVDPNA